MSAIMEFRDFERVFNEVRRVNNMARKDAKGTLSPAMIERGIRSGSGAKTESASGEHEFSADDLKRFRQKIKQTQKQYGSAKGAPVKQLIAESRALDVKRSNEQIRFARLYQVRGNLLKFLVPASGESGFDGNYQVRIRLEDWSDSMISGRAFGPATAAATSGRVSIDCQCGRHQYWYRYLAGVGGYAVTPPQEKDFPKIRNPELTGTACKHVLKVLQTLQSPTVRRVLEKEMERQANAVGYSDIQSRFLSKEDHKTLDRAKPRKIDQESAAAAYKDYLKSAKGLKSAVRKSKEKKMQENSEIQVLKAKDKARRAQVRQAREEATKAKAEAQTATLSAALNKARMDAVMKAAMSGGDAQKAHSDATSLFAASWAKDQGMTPDRVLTIIRERGL